VIFQGLLHPDHIVEEQAMAISWRQALMCEARVAHHDGAEFTDFGMNTKLMHRLPPAICLQVNILTLRESG
jgi:hypothetical protein